MVVTADTQTMGVTNMSCKILIRFPYHPFERIADTFSLKVVFVFCALRFILSGKQQADRGDLDDAAKKHAYFAHITQHRY